MRRVSVLVAVAGTEGTARDATFRIGLERRGWTDGRNVRIDTHLLTPAFSSEQVQKVAKELIALQPDVIIVQSTPYTAALQQQTLPFQSSSSTSQTPSAQASPQAWRGPAAILPG